MHTNRTPARPSGQPRPIPFPLILFMVAVLVLLGCLAAWAMADDGPRGRVDADDGDPYIVTPAATAVQSSTDRRQLELTLDLPPLDPDQSYWLRKARIIARCPLCAAVDKPPLPALADDPNAYTVWLALIFTESRYQPWAVSDIGCFGLGQLCGALQTPDTDALPELNLYASAAEFSRLIASSASLNEAIESYKGVTTGDTKWQADTVWSYVRVGGGK